MELKRRIVSGFYDCLYGVSTHGRGSPQEVGIANPEFHGYGSTISYAALRKSLRAVPLPPADISFLDLGSGKGRPLVVAATLGCASVHGVEIVPHLAQTAKKNLARMRWRHTQDVAVIATDATSFEIPERVNVVYIANSFGGRALARVLDNLYRSHAQYLLYFNSAALDQRRPQWLTPMATEVYYHRFAWTLYEIHHEWYHREVEVSQ